jgi:hypothetical protein
MIAVSRGDTRTPLFLTIRRRRSLMRVVPTGRSQPTVGDRSASGPRTAVVAEPSGSFDSTAFESRRSPTPYPGVSRARHFQEANESLLRASDSDRGFAQSMRELGVDLERTPIGLAPRATPAGWTWHHAQQPGAMQLVPRLHIGRISDAAQDLPRFILRRTDTCWSVVE